MLAAGRDHEIDLGLGALLVAAHAYPTLDIPTYLQKIDDCDHAGVMKTMGEGMPPYWCPYFFVNEVDEDLERASGLGANVIVPAKDIPNIGRFGVITDPAGATLALFTSSGKAC